MVCSDMRGNLHTPPSVRLAEVAISLFGGWEIDTHSNWHRCFDEPESSSQMVPIDAQLCRRST